MMGPAIGGAVMYVVVIVARKTIAAPHLGPIGGMALLVAIGVMVYPLFMWLFFRGSFLELLALIGRAKNERS
jgi:hypothetical protein